MPGGEGTVVVEVGVSAASGLHLFNLSYLLLDIVAEAGLEPATSGE